MKLAALQTLVWLGLSGGALAQPAIDAAAGRLGFAPEAVQKLMRGEVIVRDESPSSKRELAAAAAVLIHAPLDRVAEMIRTGEAFNADPDNTAAQTLPDRDVTPADLGPMSLNLHDLPEVHALLHAQPGEALNLSADEAARFKGLRAGLKGPESERDALEARIATDELRRILSERTNAYRKQGLKGTPPYARKGDKQTSPGDELAHAAAADQTLGPEWGAFRSAILEPQTPAPGVESRFLIHKSEVEQQTDFVINNVLFTKKDGQAAFVQRQFYVLHSYNAAEITGLCVAAGDSTVVFYCSRSSTDAISGFGEEARRKIGQSELRDDLTGFLRGFRDRVQAAGKEPGK